MLITPDPSAVFRQLEDGGVILNVETGDYYEVNQSGRYLWETIGGGCQLNDLVASMALEYGISSKLANDDIEVFLAQLSERSLVEVTD